MGRVFSDLGFKLTALNLQPDVANSHVTCHETSRGRGADASNRALSGLTGVSTRKNGLLLKSDGDPSLGTFLSGDV